MMESTLLWSLFLSQTVLLMCAHTSINTHTYTYTHTHTHRKKKRETGERKSSALQGKYKVTSKRSADLRPSSTLFLPFSLNSLFSFLSPVSLFFFLCVCVCVYVYVWVCVCVCV